MRWIFMLVFTLAADHALLAQQSISSRFFTQRSISSDAQKKINFNGQWRGGFNVRAMGYPSDYQTEYVLELTIQGTRVFGYSYTYFREGEKKYYTICRLTGSIDRTNNELVVTEVERTKYNTPPEFENCFQVHRLRYERGEDNTEILRGTWMAAPGQTGNCGQGITVLSRKIVNRLPFGIRPNTKKENIVKAKPAPKPPVITKRAEPRPQAKAPAEANKRPAEKEKDYIVIQPDNKILQPPPAAKFEVRRNDIVKRIFIDNPTFSLAFYDNGEIDGDSISVFYNGKLVLSHKKLSDKPLTLSLELDDDVEENIVTMYADNLGSIPPNTAVMIVTDGDKRYEVRITSDTEKSGSVIFRRKPKD